MANRPLISQNIKENDYRPILGWPPDRLGELHRLLWDNRAEADLFVRVADYFCEQGLFCSPRQLEAYYRYCHLRSQRDARAADLLTNADIVASSLAHYEFDERGAMYGAVLEGAIIKLNQTLEDALSARELCNISNAIARVSQVAIDHLKYLRELKRLKQAEAEAQADVVDIGSEEVCREKIHAKIQQELFGRTTEEVDL
jgi:hypothetical protein